MTWAQIERKYKKDAEVRKRAVLAELGNGAKREFYAKCLEADYAFDVDADGTKYEVTPARRSYRNGAVASFRGAESEYQMPEFSYDELRGAIGL